MKQESIDKLVSEALAIEKDEASKAGAIGYMARALIQATLPHSKVSENEFKRRNGAFKLTLLADSEVGLPYGSIPRILMSWITTEAVKTKNRELRLGHTLSEFMSELDMIPSGGRWGNITRLKDQMKRLFSASISCTYDDGDSWSIRNVMPVEKAELWWNPQEPQQAGIWESKLLLGDTFFREIVESPIPIDIRALKALRQSPMAIDIYCWLTYRMSYLRRIANIPWHALKVQFGANYKDVRQFKSKFLMHLKKVLYFYPEARIKDDGANLILLPSKTHIIKQEKSIPKIELDKNKDKEQKHKLEEEKQKKYLAYKLDELINIIDNISDQTERHVLLKEFEEYLTRKGLTAIRAEIIKGQHTKNVKEELYNFVNSNWHHVFNKFKSYEEFCEIIA